MSVSLERESMWIKCRREVAPSGWSLLPRVCVVLCAAVIFGVASQVCAGQTTIAAKRYDDLYISLMSQSGKLVEKGGYCALFSRTNGAGPTQVENVIIEFAQQVGKVRERASKVPLLPDGQGRYCGEVDLGKQYYNPAFYYVGIGYTDRSQKRKRCLFFLTRR
jgi:hypothetical protein